uniref:Major facilitator superfamily (MFS) profile domain-containing protein n=1 Tax=Araucaria cunninghamii TaxID=56994 RepID=A0A0D6QY37_ARACU
MSKTMVTEKAAERTASETETQKFALDGSVDLQGRPVLRAKTGGLKACSFIVGFEFCERLAFGGIGANLVIYLTNKLHEGTVSASRNVTNWIGTMWLMPILGAYIADTHWGRYWTFLVFAFVYLMGMILLTLAVSLTSLRPPECPSGEGCQRASTLQTGFFYLALYLLALGAGGIKPNISTFGADQFDDFDPRENSLKNHFFNWWMFTIFLGILFGKTILIYVEDNVSWEVSYGLITAALIISIIVFLVGTPYYRHKRRTGSPLKRIAKVFTSLARNWKVKSPSDPSYLYEIDSKEYVAKGRYPIAHTSALRFLDKAASKNDANSSSRVCTVTQVEEAKLMIGILPVWLACILPSTMEEQAGTLFVKQAQTLDRHMGSSFQIPPGSTTAFFTLSMLITTLVYDRFLVPLLRRFTGNPKGITALQRMGTGMALQVLAAVIAMITEIKRLEVVRDLGLEDKKKAIVPRTIFTLMPQYILLGIADALLNIGKIDFFYDQAPESMQSLGTSLYTSTQGVGAFMNSVLITIVSEITGRGGHRGWILNNLNASHLDYYYAFLGVLLFVNLLFFFVVSYLYEYKREVTRFLGEDSEKTIEILTVNIHSDV